jgi:hypothetical protein
VVPEDEREWASIGGQVRLAEEEGKGEDDEEGDEEDERGEEEREEEEKEEEDTEEGQKDPRLCSMPESSTILADPRGRANERAGVHKEDERGEEERRRHSLH